MSPGILKTEAQEVGLGAPANLAGEVGAWDVWVFWCFGLSFFMAPLSTAGSSVAGGLFFLLYIIKGYWRQWAVLKERPWSLPLAAMILLNVLGMLWTADLTRGGELLARSSYLLLAFAGATLPWNARFLRLFLKLFLAGLFINALVGILQWFDLYPWRPMDPVVGPRGYPHWIFLSLVLSSALIWLVYDFKHRFLLSRPWNLLLAGLFFWQLAFIGGRTGQLAFLLLFPVALWMLFPGQQRRWALALTVVGLLALILSPMAQQRMQQGVEDLKQYEAGNVSTSWGQRLVFWQGAIKLAEENPILGVGTGDYKSEMQGLQDRGQVPATPLYPNIDHPHNSYLAYLSGLGIPGLLLFLWFLYAVARESWPCRMTPAGWFKLSYLAVFLVGSLFDTLIWGHNAALLLGLSVAIPPMLGATWPGDLDTNVKNT